jgi:SNF2 family DNA or RNA helicase
MKKIYVAGVLLNSDVGTADVVLTLPDNEGSSIVQLEIRLANHLTAENTPSTNVDSMGVENSVFSMANLSTVIGCLLERDGLALKDFSTGNTASFTIDLRSTSASRVEPNPRNLASYVLARATAAQYVVPLLLEPPRSLPLFPYQIDGVKWLCSKRRAILADDMGLGKTLQAIVATRQLFFSNSIGSVLVVCPKSLIANWEFEITKWVPDLIHIRMVPCAAISEKAWEKVLGSAHILITTYEQMRVPAQLLRDRGVDLLIADEAHRIRNQTSLTANGIRAVKAPRFWALTGTPIERDTFDLATILSILSPKSCSPADAKLSLALVRSNARPFVLRRLKSEVLKELPPVIENREVLELTTRQRRAYNVALETFTKAIGDQQMLALITRLRGICDYEPDTRESAKAVRILEILSDIQTAGEKAIVFSHLTEPLQLMRSFLRRKFGDNSIRMLLGQQSMEERQSSVTDFKSLVDVRFLLASSRVGGEGLTLTEANNVIFFNEWWNPSSNDQARDRVVRLGQKKGVFVYTFVCRNTIEETLLDILTNKRATFDDVVNNLAEKTITDAGMAAVKAELRNSLAHHTP